MAWRKLFHCNDAEEAEAIACLEAVRLAERWEDAEILLESDCAMLWIAPGWQEYFMT